MFLLETSNQRSKGFRLILVWVQLQRKFFSFNCVVNSVKLHSGLDLFGGRGTHTFRFAFFCILFCSKKYRHYLIFLFLSLSFNWEI